MSVDNNVCHFWKSYQCIVIAEQGEPVNAVLLCSHVAALLFVDGISFILGQAEEAADHAQILPQRPVLWTGFLLPTQQLAQPSLKEICAYAQGGYSCLTTLKIS